MPKTHRVGDAGIARQGGPRMFEVVPSLDGLWQGLSLVFTEASLVRCQELFVGLFMCLGNRTEFRVFEAFHGRRVSRRQRHPFDRYYNFFSRSAWTVGELARYVATLIVVSLLPAGELQ